MAKKAMPAKKSGKSAPSSMTADDHRKHAQKLRAMGRLHEAKADMLDVQNPPKKSKTGLVSPY